MIGAIIGDIVGSRFEWNNIKSKNFELLTYRNHFTDDTVMTLAIAKALLDSTDSYNDLGNKAILYMQSIGRKYPDCGYGSNFSKWLFSDDTKPYGSFGNGAAMRVSACGYVANSIDEAARLSKIVTEVTHNHPEGIKGAEATAIAIFLAKSGSNILEIRDYINKNYYKMDFKLDDIRSGYVFNESCQGTVPQAIEAFLESNSFEDAVRNAISIGGDSDTLAAITGGIAGAYYGIPTELRKHALTFLDERLMRILIEYENKYSPIIEKINKSGSIKVKPGYRNIKIGGRSKMMEDLTNKADMDLKQTETMIEETSSQKLFNHLYQACNILRGPINQDEYKSYVTPILFFKRISDVYDEETEKALVLSGGDAKFAAFSENHSFIIPDDCHWEDVRNTSVNVGSAIVHAMSGIERANPDTLAGVFSSFDDANWTDKFKLSDDRLKDLVEHMSLIKVGNNNYSADVMGDAYEYLIKKFADLSKKNAGEFYTPRAIVKLLVKLLNPKPGDTVYDPACGTGGMLIEAINHIQNDKMTYGRVYGQEKNLSTSAIARMNLFLHGAKDFKISQGDTLRFPSFLEAGKLKKFNCVIANPPFSLDKWGADMFASDPYGRNIWGTPTDSNADFAWLQHMVKSMNSKNGRCAVVLPQGVLFHGGNDKEMRMKLVEEDILEAIILLPSGVFYSTTVYASILLLNTNKNSTHDSKVFMINASSIYQAQRAIKIITEKQVDEIYDLFSKYEDKKQYSKIVSISDIVSKDYSLMPNIYIEHETTESIEIDQTKYAYFDNIAEIKCLTESFMQLLKKEGMLDE